MIYRCLAALATAGTIALATAPAYSQSGAYICMRNPNYNTGQWIRFERVRNGRIVAAGNFYFRPRQRRQIRTGYGAVRYCWGYTRNAVAGGCRPGYIRYARKGYCAGGGGGGNRPASYSCFTNRSQQYGRWLRIESVRGGRIVWARNVYVGPNRRRRVSIPYGYARWCWGRTRTAIAGGCRPGYWRTVQRGNC